MVFLTLCRLTEKNFKGGGKFIDRFRITVKGGAGGMGHPKYGGIGGKGGDVILVATEDITLTTLLHRFPTKLIKASEGENSHTHRLVGEKGADRLVPVPTGVTVSVQGGAKLGELNKENDQVIVAHGGLGGQAATQFSGMKGEEHKILLDLKLIADVGLVGFPNAGKSSLLKAISRAKPRVADYPFTTLKPQLGTIIYDDDRKISMADLPGLIEGAHQNRGLGYRFLKHIERTKLLVFMVDIHGFCLGPKYPHRSPLETVALLNKELELYGKDILSKPALLVVNKMDTENAEAKWQELKPQLENYQDSLCSLPEKIRPTQLAAFDEVLNISVQQDPEAVRKVALKIRRLLDLYDDLESTKSPLKQLDEDKKEAEERDRIQLSLKEHQSTILV